MQPLKILGLILLIAGILIIFYSLFNSYNIFTGKSLPPTLFKLQEVKEEPASTKETLTLEEKAEKMAEEEFQKQLQKIFPVDNIPKLLNLISWSILAGILIFGGAQIAGLGVKLIKI